MRTVPSLIEDLVAQLAEDAEALDCAGDLARCATIVAEGTSADVQLAVFEEARSRSGGQAGGLAAVVDWLASETRLDGTALAKPSRQRLRGAA